LLAAAEERGGPFEPHLREILSEFRKPENLALARTFDALTKGDRCPDEQTYERLMMLGVINGTYHGDAKVRCGLYASWFPPRLPK
jgi:hypothetical protein